MSSLFTDQGLTLLPFLTEEPEEEHLIAAQWKEGSSAELSGAPCSSHPQAALAVVVRQAGLKFLSGSKKVRETSPYRENKKSHKEF